jgi:folate-binding protein YgfZ
MLTPQLLAEYDALRFCGYVPLPDRTKLELRGADRVKFLNSFCTNDIKRLQPGDSCEAFICNVKGHVIGHVLVLCCEDALLLDTVPGQGAKLVAHLDRYLIREDVQIVDRTADLEAVLVAGEQAGVGAGERGGGFAISIGQSRIVWLGKGQMPDTRLVPCRPEALEIVRIESGFPWYGVDIAEDNLPQEVNRNAQAISFTKGCYLGQETVARIDALGHVNKTLCGVAFSSDSVPAVGLELRASDKVVGQVTSAGWSPKLGRALALGYIRRGHEMIGTNLTSNLGEATVVELPV